jgi:hypothetical protein
MSTDFRALCAELADALNGHTSLYEGHESELVARARTTLAQPEPEGVGPSDEEWDELRAHFERILCDARSSGGPVVGNIALADHLINAVYARFGRPAIEPVPVSERLPGPEDCFSDQHGQRSYKCWAQQYHTDNDDKPLRTVSEAWDLVDYRLLARCRRWYYAWLPHHALPVPAAEAP